MLLDGTVTQTDDRRMTDTSNQHTHRLMTD